MMLKRVALFAASAVFTASTLMAAWTGISFAVPVVEHALGANQCAMLVDSDACLDTSHVVDARPAHA